MSYNYSGFVQSLANMLVIDPTDPNYQIFLPNVIDDAEQRLYRELDLLNTITRQAGTLTANSRSFTLPSSGGRMVVTESISIFDLSGNRRVLPRESTSTGSMGLRRRRPCHPILKNTG
jgi:hypothetical protein